jgi:Flp pilus assembly protein TadG
MKQAELKSDTGPVRRSGRRRGSETVEFTLVLLPLLALLGATVDTAWLVWAKSTLQQSVRVGVRTGITLTGAQMATNGNLTDTVKGIVQANALGLLRGSAGLATIKVHYFQPPSDLTQSGQVLDVTGNPDANKPYNIMQVSVQNYSLIPLLPRIFGWRTAVDTSPTSVNAFSADVIEFSRDVPPVGPAP